MRCLNGLIFDARLSCSAKTDRVNSNSTRPPVTKIANAKEEDQSCAGFLKSTAKAKEYNSKIHPTPMFLLSKAALPKAEKPMFQSRKSHLTMKLVWTRFALQTVVILNGFFN